MFSGLSDDVTYFDILCVKNKNQKSREETSFLNTHKLHLQIVK